MSKEYYNNIYFKMLNLANLKLVCKKQLRHSCVQKVYSRLFRCVMGEDDIDAVGELYHVVTICGCFSIPVKTKVFQVITPTQLQRRLFLVNQTLE